MKRDCSEIWEAILDLAEGKPSPLAEEHLRDCAGCREKLAQATKLVKALGVKQEAAPANLVEWAKGLMQGAKRMRLLRTTLSLSGARSGATDFQSVYEAEGAQIRVLYSKVPEGWEVVSKTPDSTWNVSRFGDPVETDGDGRFRFITVELSDSGFEMESGGNHLAVPSGAEAASGADERTP